jgi:hypothetical protein
VRGFRQKCTPEGAIEFHAFALLETSTRVTNGIHRGCSLPLTVTTVNSVQILKEKTISREDQQKELEHARSEASMASMAAGAPTEASNDDGDKYHPSQDQFGGFATHGNGYAELSV